MIGLELLSPKLVDRLRTVAPLKQRMAALAASEFAIKKAGISNDLTDKAIGVLKAGKLFPGDITKNLDALVMQLDDEYFRLQEAADSGDGTKEEYLRAFAKARAVAALGFAGKGDPFEAAVESIYEAAATILEENKDDLLDLVNEIL